MGLQFETSVVREVLADVGESSAQSAELRALASEGFVREVPDSGGHRLQFAHASIQAVTYELLPERQRQALHGATARALERMHADQAAPVYGRLAHHYAEAEVLDKAAQYSALAAEQALDSYANEDAVHLYERALRFDERSRPGLSRDLQRARWYAGLAQAHYSLTHPTRDQRRLRPGAGAGRVPGAGGRGQRRAGAAAVSGPATAGAAGPPRPPAWSDEQRLRVQMVVGLLPEWAALDVWEGRLNSGAAKFFACHALAEKVLPSGDAAHAIGGTGYLLGMTPLRRLGEAESQRAVALADASGELKARASTRVTLGMYYTIMGEPQRALPQLEAAQAPAERLGAGLWKHRTRFQLAEPLFMLARYREASAVFREAAALSMGAEPPITGLANCLSALADVRTGDAEGALGIIDGPRRPAAVLGRQQLPAAAAVHRRGRAHRCAGAAGTPGRGGGAGRQRRGDGRRSRGRRVLRRAARARGRGRGLPDGLAAGARDATALAASAAGPAPGSPASPGSTPPPGPGRTSCWTGGGCRSPASGHRPPAA